MPKLPYANNDSSVKDNYESKKLYDYYYEEDLSQFDTWYDSPFYGKVDTLGRVVYPKESFLTTVSKFEDEEQTLCLEFVANAFRKMRMHYNVLYLDGYIETNSEFFKNTLQPLRAWHSPTKLYEEEQQFLYEALLTDVLENLSESPLIQNFNDFVKILLDYVKDKTVPFTRIGFHESPKASAYTTGLVIEIFKGEYGNDAQAFSFINDPNFELFEELCSKHGFKIDRNNPWRIIANIGSNNMAPFIAELGIGTVGKEKATNLEQLFDVIYERLDLIAYFNEFYQYLKIFYETFRQAFPTYKQETFGLSECKKIFFDYKNRMPIADLIEEDRLELFYDFRIAEAGLKVSPERRSFHLKNILSIFKTFKNNPDPNSEADALRKALNYIEFNLGTVGYRDVSVGTLNLTRLNNDGILSIQTQFDKRTGEDSGYLNNDFSNT
tara:strand:+ start:3044 stop:4357 length:1314 start_codon:yes stop_codon:yes gene_type:complete